MKRFICTLALLTGLTHGLNAYAETMQGVALVKIHSKRINWEMQQAVKIDEDQAVFVGLDDFGNVAFVARFAGDAMYLDAGGGASRLKDSRFKAALSLPVGQKEFLSILRHERPEGYESETKDGVEVWTHPKKKKFAIHLMDTRKKQGKTYPGRILMVHKKNTFDLKWQSLQFVR